MFDTSAVMGVYLNGDAVNPTYGIGCCMEDYANSPANTDQKFRDWINPTLQAKIKEVHEQGTNCFNGN